MTLKSDKKKLKRKHPIEYKSGSTGPLDKDIKKNVARIKKDLGNSVDLLVREICIDEQKNISIAILHFDGMSNEQIIDQGIIDKLVHYCSNESEDVSIDEIKKQMLKNVTVSAIKNESKYDNLMAALLYGNTVILLNNCTEFLNASTRIVQSRGITEPTTQTVIRGPKDCFTESIRTNTSLIRNRIQNPALRIEGLVIGDVTRTDIAIVYVEGLAEESLVNEVRTRLQSIKIDEVLESSYIESLISDDQKTIFPTMLNTERPDAVAGNILEGRVAILTGGTPYALILPATFLQFFQSPEDYYHNQYIGSAVRLLRFIGFIVALLAPGVFVAVLTHHQGIVPTVLLVSLAAQREGVPFPAIVEALLMEFTFEVLREAGIRMPRAVGQALSIVGALILGQAAVQAGFVSAAMVILVSITAIASFTIPYYNLSIAARLLRFIFLLLGAYIGLFGILIGWLILVTHMCSLRSFGAPYLAAFAPFRLGEHQDGVLIFPLNSNNEGEQDD